MPRDAITGVFTRVSNSFSNPVFGTLIDPTDADALFDDQDVGLNPPQLAGPVEVIGPLVVTSNNANALSIGLNGATDPVLQVDASTASQAAGLRVVGNAAGAGVGLVVIDSATNSPLAINAKGSGSLAIGSVSTGAVSVAKVTFTPPATGATITIPDGVTLTGPAVSGTAMTLGNTETVTGVKTFGSAGAVGRLKIAGTTSGSTTLDATAIASGTLTLPAATDTLVGKSTIDTLTGKTFDTAGASNSFLINGVAVTANTGTGAVARAAGPTFTTPALGAATATTINGSTVSPGQYTGEPSTGSASAGNIGEYVEAILASGSATSLVSGTDKTVTSISLTAGDWDVDCMAYFIPTASTSVTRLTASMSLVTNTVDTTAGRFNQMPMAAVVSGGPALSAGVPPHRFSLSGTTTVYLVGSAAFTASTLTAFGIIRARRAR